MEMVAEEKMRMVKKARLAVELEQELKDKAREVAALKLERQRKKIQIDELESIVRLKQAEADMFELKANEARREAERLQRIALAKTEKSERIMRVGLLNCISFLLSFMHSSGFVRRYDIKSLVSHDHDCVEYDGQFEDYCIADEQTPEDQLVEAMNWACGNGADCRAIQENQPSYLPNTARDHASYAFNSYYQNMKHKGGSCYFNAAAV
ncbi:UNVERIFIED_CONTAM: Glucan endo-1,3-beta-glucosidase 12 [Sesamum angustifolium]|uniref:Glucan endo-1,3-beta-glucosidase 12 n=1 Tax=Sesamum angustifolium TaxID=2727405 RepID=A0AAW2PCE2_9LAMI